MLTKPLLTNSMQTLGLPSTHPTFKDHVLGVPETPLDVPTRAHKRLLPSRVHVHFFCVQRILRHSTADIYEDHDCNFNKIYFFLTCELENGL